MIKTLTSIAAAFAVAATAAQAAELTWTIDVGVQFYDDDDIIQPAPPANPIPGTLTGTLIVDSTVGEITSADLVISGLPTPYDNLNGFYDVVAPVFNFAFILQVARAGTLDFQGADFIQFALPSGGEIESGNIGDQIDLTRPFNTQTRYSSLSICAGGDTGGCGGSFPQIVFEGSATLTDINPVPVPAAAPLMLAGLGALGLRRRRKAA